MSSSIRPNTNGGSNFEIHEDAQGRVFVKDLSMVTVTSREEVDAIVQCGLKLRSTHETKMNAVSSRSHTVFTIHIFQQGAVTKSERLKKSESDGQRLKEALHINSSLSAVGKVVMSLDPESGYNYIPYRDSKLTRLLQNSIGAFAGNGLRFVFHAASLASHICSICSVLFLCFAGGNSFTTLIATIHPMKEHYEECLGTLQFANRCRSVQNQVGGKDPNPRVNHINGTVADKDRRIRKLQEELSLLRRQLEGLRTEYNNRLVTTLNELGFQAEEISESGEIKFAVRCVALLFPSLGFPKKEKEDARRVISEQKRRIATLESALQQKAVEYERGLAAEAARHRTEMRELLNRNNQMHTGVGSQQQPSTAFDQPRVDVVQISTKRDQQTQQVCDHFILRYMLLSECG
ncbi:hypothetical protein BBJ28_00014994 [Nothophytophthora sp. Chile5]|nr:hypothetical protein BBJ28_00014994 [Nothophytophthora sp. Chile5]